MAAAREVELAVAARVAKAVATGWAALVETEVAKVRSMAAVAAVSARSADALAARTVARVAVVVVKVVGRVMSERPHSDAQAVAVAALKISLARTKGCWHRRCRWL